ncbi:hypothetical protein ACFL9T_22905 [Thermodesulfobacteriota bacterium]
MSSVGWVQSINASTILDKEQHVQQTQADNVQAHAVANALREQALRQKRVTGSQEGEQVRLRKRRKKEQGKQSREDPDSRKKMDDAEDLEPAQKRINLTV